MCTSTYVATYMVIWYALAKGFHSIFKRLGDCTATFISERWLYTHQNVSIYCESLWPVRTRWPPLIHVPSHSILYKLSYMMWWRQICIRLIKLCLETVLTCSQPTGRVCLIVHLIVLAIERCAGPGCSYNMTSVVMLNISHIRIDAITYNSVIFQQWRPSSGTGTIWAVSLFNWWRPSLVKCCGYYCNFCYAKCSASDVGNPSNGPLSHHVAWHLYGSIPLHWIETP